MPSMDDPVKAIAEIRGMMERSSKFLSLSGLAGLSAGLAALAGAAVAYYVTREGVTSPGNLTVFFTLDAAAVLVMALGLAFFFTGRMARRKNIPVWGSASRHLLWSLLPPLIAGGLFTVILFAQGFYVLIPCAMLVFYGLGLLSASKYTVPEIQLLAAAEIALGLAAGVATAHWLLLWVAGFGALHILYGISMYYKYER